MQIQQNLTGVRVSKTDSRYNEHLAWFRRNDIRYVDVKDGIFGAMDKITLNRWEKYFRVAHKEEQISNEDREAFEEYAQFNLPIDIDNNGDYIDDATFQAWQFFKLGKKT